MNSHRVVSVIVTASAFLFSWYASADEIAPRVVTCQGPFARDSSPTRLARTFGDKNVVVQEVEGGEGAKLSATVLYPNDLRRRLEILWKNENPQQGLDSIRIIGESQWTAGHGLKLGLTVDEVEALNGVPFEIRNFNLEYGGAVTSWHGGALSKVPGGCRLAPGFAPANGTTANAYQKIGYDDLLSNNPDLGVLRLRVIGIVIHYRN